MIQKRSTIDPDLYEADETAWLEAMSELIEQGRVDDLDYPHLSEYLSDMAKRDRREVISRLVVLIKHALKWTYQPKKRTRSWHSTIVTQQQDLEDDLSGGVLRQHAQTNLGLAYSRAVTRAALETGLRAESFPQECPYTLDQLLTLDIPAIE
ncbi:MAG: DUF29 domain-containing protein [Pirellulales bacterium]